jgi:hypothetical protein
MIFIFAACTKAKQEKQTLLFNCDSLIDHHAKQLSQTKARLTKSTSLRDAPLLTGTDIHQVQWEKELEAFKLVSIINKPVYRTAYDIEVVRDPKSNLIVKTWKAKGDEPVRLMKIYFLDKPGALKKWEAVVEKGNFVFRSQQKLEMEFGLLGNSQLERFTVSGFQKFFWGNPNTFTLQGLVK